MREQVADTLHLDLAAAAPAPSRRRRHAQLRLRPVADQVLRGVADVISQSVRNIDLAARIGGDEFGVLMPNTNLEEGVGVAMRILAAADGLIVSDEEFHADVHLSIGTASFDGRGLADGTQLFLRANEALKAAKAGGKNRVCFFDPLRRSASQAFGAPGSIQGIRPENQ